MMTSYVRYDPATGRIVQRGECAASDLWLNRFPEFGLLEAPCRVDLDYVDLTGEAHVVRERPTLPGFDKTAISADDTDVATLSLPAPFTVEIDGTAYPVDQADETGAYVLALASPMPATYKVSIKQWPYLDFSAEIVAS